jgi:TP901 family phage tail tape measure protein
MAAVKQKLEVIAKLNDQFSSGMEKIDKSVSKTFSDDPNKKGSFLSGVKASSVALGALAVGGLVAVGKGLGAAFNSAKEFEQSMADVAAITGATGKDFDSMSKLARDMGAKTAFSANQAAEGIQFLGMAGFDTNEIMTALPDTLSLASAAGMDLGAAADISSNILSGMGMKADELGGVVDKLAQTSRNANTDVAQLGEAFTMVGPTSAAAGVEFDDVTTSLGLLANAGLQGSIGGTSLNAAFRSMINPSNKAAKAAEKLGVTFTDATGNIKPMRQILTELDDASMTTKESFQIFGVQGARAINALRANGVEAFDKLDAKIKESGGVAEDMAKTRLGSFEGAMKQLNSGISEFSISVGEQMLPAANTIINEFLIPAVQKTNEFVQSFGGFGEMFKATKELFVAFANTGKNILNELFSSPEFAEDFLGNLGEVFTASMRLVSNFAFGTTGQGGMLGIIREVGKIVWEPFKQSFLALWDFLKVPLVNGINNVKEMFVNGANAIIEEFNNLGEVFGVTIDKIDFTPITVEAPKTFKERWAEGSENVGKSIDTIAKIADEMVVTVGEDTEKVVGSITKTVDSASHLVDDNFDKVVGKFTDTTKEMEKEAKKGGEEIGEELGTATTVSFEEYLPKPNFFVQKFNVGKDLLSSMDAALGDKRKGLGSVLGGAFKGATSGGSFKQIIGQAASQIGTMLAGPIGGLVAGGLAKAIFGGTNKAKRAKKRAASDVGLIQDLFEAAGGDVRNISGEEFNVASDIYKSKGLDDKRAGILFQKQLEEAGMKPDAAGILVRNILPKMVTGRPLGAKEVRIVNQALTNLAVLETIRENQATENQEKFRERIDDLAASGGYKAAAGGYDGMVSKPTLFLAGEAGAEHVNITPSSRMNGGFTGSGGSNLNFNFTVQTIDSKGVQQFIENDAKDFMINVLQKESARGRSVLYDTGVVTDPDV